MNETTAFHLTSKVAYEIKKNDQIREKQTKDFWEREALAGFVRKKDISQLPYITVPLSLLPGEESFCSKSEKEMAALESLRILKNLSDKRILNLSGISNTDLKLTYGTANITALSQYDENYETFSKHIYLLSRCLFDLGRIREAKKLLEETLPYNPDIAGHYLLLAQIYAQEKETEKIKELISLTENLNTFTKKRILDKLNTYIEGQT